MSKAKGLTEAKIRLANHYLGVIKQAVSKSGFQDIDSDWLQVKALLEHGQVQLTRLNPDFKVQQWASILDITYFVCQTNGYLNIRGHWEEAQLYLKVAIQAATTLQDTKLLHELTLLHADILYRLGKIDEAAKDFEHILHTLQDKSGLGETGAARKCAAIYEQLGMISVLRGEYATAKTHLDESLRIRIELDVPKGLEFTYIQLGNLATAQEEYGKADTYFRQALRIQERQNALPLDIARTLRQLSKTAFLKQELSKAQNWSERSLRIAYEYSDRQGIANDLTSLGILSYLENNLDQAQVMLDKSLQIRKEIGDLEGMITTLDGLSEVIYKKGDIIQAQSYYQQSLHIAETLKAPKKQATSTYQMGTLFYFNDDFGEAWKLYERSLASLEELGTLHPTWRSQREKHQDLIAKRKNLTHQLAELTSNPAPLWHSTYPHRGWIVGACIGWLVSSWFINQNVQTVIRSDLAIYLVGCFIGAISGLVLGILLKLRERNQFVAYIQDKLDSFQEMESQSLNNFPHIGKIKPTHIMEQHLQFYDQEFKHIQQLMLSEEDTQPWLHLYEPYGAAIGIVIGIFSCLILGWPLQDLATKRFIIILGVFGYGFGNRFKAYRKRQFPHKAESVDQQTKTLDQFDLARLQIISDRNWLQIISEGCKDSTYSLFSYEVETIYQIEELEKSEDVFWRAIVFRNLAGIALKYGDYSQSKHYYQRSLTLMQLLENHDEIAKSFHLLGNLAYCSNEFVEAQKYYYSSLQMREEIDDTEEIVSTLSHLGRLAIRIEEYGTAKEQYQRCLTYQEARNDLSGLMRSLNGISVAARYLNDLTLAREFSEWHLAIATELENGEEMSLAHASLAKLAHREGRIEELQAHLHKAIDLATEGCTRAIEMLNLALVYAQHRRFHEAVQLLKFVELISFEMPADFTKVIMKLLMVWQGEASRRFWGRAKH